MRFPLGADGIELDGEELETSVVELTKVAGELGVSDEYHECE